MTQPLIGMAALERSLSAQRLAAYRLLARWMARCTGCREPWRCR